MQADLAKESSWTSQLNSPPRRSPGFLQPSPTDSDVTRPQDLATCGCQPSAAARTILQELRAFRDEVRSELQAHEERIVRLESSVGAGAAQALQTIDDAVTKQLERQLNTFVDSLGALRADVQQVLEAHRVPQVVKPTDQEDAEHELLTFVGEACEPLTFRGAIPTLPTHLREGICRSNAAAAVEAAAVQLLRQPCQTGVANGAWGVCLHGAPPADKFGASAPLLHVGKVQRCMHCFRRLLLFEICHCCCCRCCCFHLSPLA